MYYAATTHDATTSTSLQRPSVWRAARVRNNVPDRQGGSSMENTFHRPSRADQERIDVVRSRSNDFQNQIIDQYTDGRLSRRGFTRGAVAVGLALPFVGFVLAACSPTGTTTGAATAGGKGGLLRAGLTAP